MRYEGKVYRPWMESNSVLIQVTLGCSNNKCTFCNMFKDKTFRKRDINDVFEDIDSMRNAYPHVESIFLIDGNVMVLKNEYLLKVLNKIKTTFPECKHIALYSEFNDLRRKSVEELIELKEAGVSIVYVGLESGDRDILDRIKKKMTPEQAIEGAEKAKAAGIKVLASFIFGLGGRERSKEHIIETTKLLNVLKPEEIAPMALAVQPGTELEEEVERGKFILPTPLQILEEEQYLLENLDFETFYWGDHGNNVVSMRGDLPEFQKRFLDKVKDTIATHPVTKQNAIQTFAW